MNNDKMNEYCKEVVDTFVKEYADKIEENINKMLEYIGFKGNKEQAGDFLEENGYQLLFDSDSLEEYSTKVIYLEKDKEIKAYFMIRILYNDNLSYEVSDIYVKDID